jgi:hypothetical protein
MERSRIHKYLTLFLCVAAFTLAGCQTPERHTAPTQVADADVVHYSGAPPVWLFIPFPTIIENASGYPAQIILRNRTYSTNRIEVAVQGEVVCPGLVRLPVGSTVLQAISQAGGFTALAVNERLRIHKASGKTVMLYLHSRLTTDRTYRQAWCDSRKDVPQAIVGNKTEKELVSDYVLDNGDEIVIDRTAG